MKGYVYVLSNPLMPDIYKIGRSINGAVRRGKELYSGSTGVPAPFEVEFEIYCDDCIDVEAMAHENLASYRISENREFFKCFREEAIEAVIMAFGETQDCVYANKEEVIHIQTIQNAIADQGGFDHECIREIHPFLVMSAYEHAITSLDPVCVIEAWKEWVKNKRENDVIEEESESMRAESE